MEKPKGKRQNKGRKNIVSIFTRCIIQESSRILCARQPSCFFHVVLCNRPIIVYNAHSLFREGVKYLKLFNSRKTENIHE
jgi:hypothetical protein